MASTQVSYDILEHILKLQLDGVSKPTFERNFEIVREKHTQQLENEKYKSVFQAWVHQVNILNDLIGKINNKFLKPQEIRLNIAISDLNNLGDFAVEIRDTVAMRIRELSVSVWNSYKEYIKAMDLMGIACSIRTSDTVRERLINDRNQLASLKAQSVEEVGTPVDRAPSLSLINGCGTTLYGSTLYFVIIGVPIFPIARYNYEQVGNRYRFYGKLKLHSYQVAWRYIFFALIAYFVLQAFLK